MTALACTALAGVVACGATKDDRTTAASATVQSSTTTADTSEARPPSSESEDPSTTNPADPELPPCGDQTSYSTIPDWMIEGVPEGLRLHYAKTVVNRYEGGSLGFDTATDHQLAAVDADGKVVEVLRVTHFPDLEKWEPEPGMSAGHAYDEMRSSVRGHEGTAGRVVNRSDPIGSITARWVEDGAGWIAGGPDDVDALLAALDPLEITSDGISDPSGRFTELGSAPVLQPETRETRIELLGAEENAVTGSEPALTITIERGPEGATGLTYLPSHWGYKGAVLSEHDGRPMLSAGRTLITTLPDGSAISIQDGTSTLSQEDLVRLVDGVVRVTEDRPYTGVLIPEWYDSSVADQRCAEG